MTPLMFYIKKRLIYDQPSKVVKTYKSKNILYTLKTHKSKNVLYTLKNVIYTISLQKWGKPSNKKTPYIRRMEKPKII